ncbi:MAG: flagellum-specific ATP synthase FliI, partial [Dongiaceae bacterium]
MSAPARPLDGFLNDLDRIPAARPYGRVAAVLGMLVEVAGLERSLSVGARCELIDRAGRRIPCEVVGFRGGRALAMAFGT